MKKKDRPGPTDAELEILRILWEQGPSTVRIVNRIQNRKRDVGYTTTLKTMQIMNEKNLLIRQKLGKSHVYHPTLPQEKMQGQLIDNILETAFGGSAARMVMQALGNHKASKEEIDRIRQLLDDMEKGEKS